MSNTVIYAVIAWLPPEIEAEYIAWLDEGHLAAVASQPGFLSGRRVQLNQVDSEGRRAQMSLYEVESEAALQAYFNSDARQKLTRDAERFKGVRMERIDGVIANTVPGHRYHPSID